MCHSTCFMFGCINLSKEEVKDKKVLEIGSRDINGSLRPYIESLEPTSYVGVDIIDGPGVDKICRVEELIDIFGEKEFDVIIATELIEHVKDWRTAIHNIKKICNLNGIILITTRSIGFPIHGFPNDFWRFEKNDMEFIFSDFNITSLENDSMVPGIFVKAIKSDPFKEVDISNYPIYSIITNKRTLDYNNYSRSQFFKHKIKSIVSNSGKYVFDIISRFYFNFFL